MLLPFLLGPLLALNPVRIAPPSPDMSFRQPQLAVSGDVVALAFGSGNQVWFAVSRDRGGTFSSPVKVGEGAALALGRHRGPRVAITADAFVVSAIVGKKSDRGDGDLLVWRSTDGGKTWSDAQMVNEVPASAREGLHAMVSDGGKLVFAAWLDLRGSGTKLYGATSRNGGATWSRSRLVYESPDGHICECCHPSAAIDSEGRIYAMWRNWVGGSRDLYISRSADFGETFSRVEKLGTGTWAINACPMDGGGVAVDAKGPWTIWRRQSAIYVVRPGTTETQIGTGKDPAIAAAPAGIYAAWSDGPGLKALLPGNLEMQLADEGAYVQLAGTDPVFAAWESKGAVWIQVLR